MKDFSPNHYERAFENWLIDNHVRYIKVDEHKKAVFGRSKIKSFDFLLHPSDGQIIIAEVKGRRFKGTSLAKLSGLECWVTTEDIEGLTNWRKVFGSNHQAIFIFAYKIENVDVDFDGNESFYFEANRYVFFGIELDDYRRFMKQRSPKWKTVNLPAGQFKRCVVAISDFLLCSSCRK
jgi:hypothetical protein